MYYREKFNDEFRKLVDTELDKISRTIDIYEGYIASSHYDDVIAKYMEVVKELRVKENRIILWKNEVIYNHHYEYIDAILKMMDS